MSRIFMRPERDNNWYYESAGQPRKSMRKFGVPAGEGGKLAANMLANKWDHEAFYSQNGLINPAKKWQEFRDEYFIIYGPPNHAELSFVKLKIAVRKFEAIVKPVFMLAISTQDMVLWRNTRLADGLKPQSVDTEERYIRPMLAYARLRGFMKEDPFAPLLPLDYDESESQHLSVPQAMVFLDLLAREYPKYAMAGLMFYECGLRVGELVHIRIQDINFMQGIAHLLPHEKFCDCYQCKKQKVPGWRGKKRSVPRHLPLSPRLNALLLGLFQERKSGNVFPVIQHWIPRVFKKVFKKMGLDIKSPSHIFRHTFATHCDQAGVRPIITSRILGHSRKSAKTRINATTAAYTHHDGDEELQRQYQQLLDWRAGHQAAQISAIQ